MSSAKKSNPAKWKRIVAAVKAGSKGGRPGQWSARKAQIAVARYKKSGGGYKGAKKKSNSLSKWSKQKWRTSDGKPSKGKKRYLVQQKKKLQTELKQRVTKRVSNSLSSLSVSQKK